MPSASSKIFAKLHGRTFKTYADLEQAALALFDEHIAEFSPPYDCSQLLELGARKDWIKPIPGGRYNSALGFRIDFTGEQERLL